MKFCNKVATRQRESKGVEDESISIFMKLGIPSEGEVQEKDSSGDATEIGVSIKL
jgi:hypothetical protein